LEDKQVFKQVSKNIKIRGFTIKYTYK